MKKNKDLENAVNKSLEELVDETFLAQMKAKITPTKHSKYDRKRILALASIAIVVMITMITSVFLFMPKNDDIPETKRYHKDNEEELSSNFSELNEDTIYFDFAELSYLNVIKYNDSQYNETLYYLVSGTNEETFDTFKFDVDTNLEHQYNEQARTYDKEYKIGEFTLHYTEWFETDGDGFYFYYSYGKIDTGREIIYIDYEGINFEEQNLFLNALENIIQIT